MSKKRGENSLRKNTFKIWETLSIVGCQNGERKITDRKYKF